MSNEDVVQEIEEEIKKAKGQPEDFEIEITDDPAKEAVEEAKDVEGETIRPKLPPGYPARGAGANCSGGPTWCVTTAAS